MLTEVKAYSSWRSAPILPLSDAGRAETDLIQIRDIQGLDPVKASVSTSPFGAVDGASFTGSSVLTRNIVLTLGVNPDWNIWTFEAIRRLLYSYFMPKRETRLIFLSDDLVPVEISGIVESVEVNMFSKDPELHVSVICPDPYFIAVNPTVITGQTIRSGDDPTIVEYNGTIEAGIGVKVTSAVVPEPTDIGIQIGDPMLTYFAVFATVNPMLYFEMSSIPMQKFVQNIDMGTGVITNLLSKVHVQEGSYWPTLQPGENEFSVVTDQGEQDWELTYFAVFATVNPMLYFEMSSIPMQKFVQNIDMGTGVITNLLSKVHVQEGSYWPTLQPGENEFSVVTDQGEQDWELTYFERFGGL